MNILSGIYKIELPDKRFYIGSSKNIPIRFNQHLRDLVLGKHVNKNLNDYASSKGVVGILFSIIECCDISDLFEKEQYYLDTLKPELNQSRTALGCTVELSEYTREKMSASRIGKVVPEATRLNMKKSAEKRVAENGMNLLPYERTELNKANLSKAMRSSWAKRKNAI